MLKQQKNKILYVITSLDYGGTQKQLYYLLKYLPDDFFTIVISLKKDNRYFEKIKKVSDIVYTLGFSNSLVVNLFLLPFVVAKLFILFHKYRPQIIHSFLFQANILSRIIKFFFPHVKLICSERVAEKQKKWQHIILKLTNFLVDKIIVNSTDLQNFVIKSQKIKKDKIVVIPNIIDTTDINFCYTPSDIKKELGLQENKFIVLSIGRLHKQKGHDLLLEIVNELVTFCRDKKIEPQFVFVILGDGEEKNNLVKYIKKHKLEKYVILAGYKANVYDYINICNLFVLTSYWEGSPNVVLEATVLRKPVVSTLVEGVKDILNKDFLVPLSLERKKIIQLFVEKILWFYLKYKNGEKLSSEITVNKNFLFDNFTPEKIIVNILKLYY